MKLELPQRVTPLAYGESGESTVRALHENPRGPRTAVFGGRQIAIGDWKLAAARLDAVLRANPNLPQADAYRAVFVADLAGRSELARMLKPRPDWLRTVLTFDEGTTDEVLTQRVVLLAEMARQNDRLGCNTPRDFVQGLLRRQDISKADAVWRAHCPAAGSIAALGDSELDRIGSDDPSGWTLNSSAELSTDVVPVGTGSGLKVDVDGAAAQFVLSQPVRFASGRLPVSWVATEGGRPSDRVDVAINCGPPQRPAMAGGSERSVEVPACPFQILSVWVAAGTGPVTIDRVRVANR